MTSASKIIILGLLCLLAVFTIAASFISVREAAVRQGSYTINAGELTRDVLIGQTFKAEQDNLSAISVMFANYSNRPNDQPIYFHLRQSTQSREDIRKAVVLPPSLGDNRFYRFEFEPIADSKDQSYFFFVVSPDSTPGNAVTVDIDTRNPYHLGSAYVVRGQGSNVTDPQVLALSGKATHDLGFEVYYTVPLRAALLNTARRTVHTTIVTWDERRSQYGLWATALVPALLFLSVLFVIVKRARRDSKDAVLTRRHIFLILLGLAIIGALLRLRYAAELPVTDDEGNYLYDAQTLLRGRLAGGDGYVKAPLMIIWVAAWQAILGPTIMAGRFASIFIGTLAILPIYIIGRELKNRYTGLAAAAAWSLIGAAVLSNVYAHTQSTALFFGISGCALLWVTLRRAEKKSMYTSSNHRILSLLMIASGMLLGLGVVSRRSILALGVVPVLLIIGENFSWRKRWKNFLQVGFGFAVIIAIFLSFAALIYGPEGFWEATGFNSAADGVATLDEAQREQERTYSLRGMTPFFRESLPLILLSLLAWGVLLEAFTRKVSRSFLLHRPSKITLLFFDHMIPKIAWLAPLGVFMWCFNFFFEYEGSAFMFYGMPTLWYAMLAMLLLVALHPRSGEEGFKFADSTQQPGSTLRALPPNVVHAAIGRTRFTPILRSAGPLLQELVPVVLLPVWVGGLFFFYMNWIKFHANYISEFIPPLTIFAGVGAYLAWQRISSLFSDQNQPLLEIVRRMSLILVLGVFGWSLFLSNYITYVYEHTGTFSQASAKEAAAWARANIPIEEPIFTGASLIPYLSGHHTALDIAHPRWYAYEFTRTDVPRLTTFLPPAEEMLQAYRGSQWFLLDKQTGFSYLMEYSEIEKGLEQDFEAVHGVENGSNTLTFYRRK